MKWGWLKDQGGASWCYIDVHYVVSCCFFLCHASKFSEKWGWFTNRVTLPQSWVRTAPNFLNTTQSTRSSLFFELPKSLTRWCQMHDSLVDPLPLKWFVKQQDRWGNERLRATPKWYFFVGRIPKRHLYYTFRFENIMEHYSNLMRSLLLHWILIVLMPLGICWSFFKTSWWDCVQSFKRPPGGWLTCPNMSGLQATSRNSPTSSGILAETWWEGVPNVWMSVALTRGFCGV